MSTSTGGESKRNRVWMTFRKSRPAIIGLGCVAILVTTALLSPWIAPYDYADQDLVNRLQPPSRAHWMGTDEYGRDVLSRVMSSSRVSLSVATVAVAILMTIGILVGALAGYYRRLDGVLMRFVDLLMSIPGFFLLLTVVALFGANLRNTMIVIGLTSWMSTARLLRGQFLSLRNLEFVEGARAVGAPDRTIILKHMLPNCTAVLIVQATLFISTAVIIESGLSYLGLGAQPPTPSWGNMLSTGRNYMRQAWWVTTFPGLAIFITVLSFNFLGDGLRDALDPRMRT